MNNTGTKILRITVLVSVCAVIVSMMAATVLEKVFGSQLAFSLVYHSPVFIALWGIAAVSGLLLIIRCGMTRKAAVMLLHVSFIIILAGALTTFLTSRSGSMHLVEAESCNYFADSRMMRCDMPFSVRLDEFQIEYYPGTNSPKDYSSLITISSDSETIQERIRMNHPLKYHGYRFYQSGYDPNLEGSTLAVSHDPWGVPISYTGYCLLMISVVAFFFRSDTRFRAALRRLGKRAAVIALLLTGLGSQAHASVGMAIPVSASNVIEGFITQRPMVPAIALVTLGIMLFIMTGVIIARSRCIPGWLVRFQIVTAAMVFLYLTAILGLRWYIQHHIPMASGFEMMMLIAWCAMLAAWIFIRRVPVLGPMAFILTGLALLVAALGESDAQITPLVPVLSSPLLAIHVTCMMVSYTLFGMAALNGIMGLAIKNNMARQNLADVTLVVVYPAVFLLTVGTFLGAIWANLSWGSYWAWDPKETWALITLMVYAFALHGTSMPRFDRPVFLHLFSIIAFFCVLITYFGVNLVLGGMHSYS